MEQSGGPWGTDTGYKQVLGQKICPATAVMNTLKPVAVFQKKAESSSVC